jgi:N-sulfoglucosamine sulfohydrolase
MNAKPPGPNVVMVSVHDIGTSLGCYGNGDIASPNFDSFAGRGVRFDSNFSTAPYCSPSRGSIITGKYPHVNGLMGLVNIGWNLPESATTAAMLFGNGGYETLLFGYQHETDDPRRLGFQSLHMKSGNHADRVSTDVVRFLDDRGTRERPFYARVGFFDTHRIDRLGDDGRTMAYDWRIYRDRAPDPDKISPLGYMNDSVALRCDLADFYGAVNFVDEGFGRILDALERNGLSGNTIVVFTTDHGIDFPRSKATLYDPGINTALLMAWPEGFKGGRSIPEMISNIDLLPTLLECCGIPIPGDVQGRSFLGLLREERYVANEMIFAEKNTDPYDVKRCIRTPDWKLIHNYHRRLLNYTPRYYSDAGPDAGEIPPDAERPEWELYDLKYDRYETINLAGDGTHEKAEEELRRRLHAIQEETGDPVLSGMVARPLSEPDRWSRAVTRRSWYPQWNAAAGKEN